jgi:glycosyltransferase involved in cell wall biosynthesis
LVSAIVSTYAAERFLHGCLKDLAQQTLASDLEVIVIDSGSPGREGEICAEFAAHHRSLKVVYQRTEREGLYTAWNRGVRLASGKYLTSANTDDRHRADALERLVQAIEEHGAALAYGDLAYSSVENETLHDCLSGNPALARYPDFSPTALMRYCVCGPQPVWRRDVHEQHGYFDESFLIAGDYEFWLRLATTERFVHVPEILGTFYRSASTLSGRGNKATLDLESLRARQRWLGAAPYSSLPGLRRVVARELFGLGYQYVSARRRGGERLLREAWRLQPLNLAYAKTYVLRGLLHWQVP